MNSIRLILNIVKSSEAVKKDKFMVNFTSSLTLMNTANVTCKGYKLYSLLYAAIHR